MLTSISTISAECWGSLLHGVEPELHQLTNRKCMEFPYDSASPYPSIFRVLRNARPGARLGSFSCWPAINIGIVEDDLDVYKSNAPDPELTEQILEYLDGGIPDLLFVQLDHVDHAGHTFGYGTKEHLDSITEADSRYGRIYDKYAAAGVLEETLFMVVSDHGGTPEKTHGGTSDAEKIITFAAAGRNIASDCPFVNAEIRDLAPITAYAMGAPIPETWTAKIPGGLFI
jgi:predicted AlkP superfamily pyrophosphatase or phosphodiesterase